MVESIVGYISGDTPILNADHSICRSELVFSGSEPSLYWPSVYIIEGLGQCCSLLSHIWTWERRCAPNGLGAEKVNTVLKNTENTDNDYTLAQLLEIFGDRTMNAASRIGMLASVDIEVVSQVQAGDLLQYSVEQTRVLGGLSHFAVQASVETQVVAHGMMVGAQLEGFL
jgi:3-hydroxymyristoyl/3-hydroxydecanoyl-(acyl carrier protein) dehydratase